MRRLLSILITVGLVLVFLMVSTMTVDAGGRAKGALVGLWQLDKVYENGSGVMTTPDSSKNR